MSQYAIMRFQKCKAGGIAARNRHNERKKTEYKSNPNIDQSKSHLNYHLVQPEGTYKEAYESRVQAVGCRTRSNSTVLVETLITATPEILNGMTLDAQRQFFERAAAFLYERIGKENVISAVVHMDETTPHMHLCFVPITKNGRLSAKDILGSAQGLSKWQDEFHAWMSERYPALSRGLPRRITHRKHIPAYQFRMAKDLSKSYGRLEEALKTVTVFNAGKKRDDALKLIGQMLPVCYSLAGQMQSTETYIRELEKAKRELEAEVAEQSQTIAQQNDEYVQMSELLEETANRAEDLKAWQRRAQRVLDQLPEDVLNMLDRKEKPRYAPER